MIRVEVEPYCQECLDFEPDLKRPEKTILYGLDPCEKPIELVTVSDSIIRCKYRNRCRKIKEYLEKREQT